MLTFRPRKELTLGSSLTPTELHARLQSHVEPAVEFPLVSKLSGAGIVIRTIQPPHTDRAFFGTLTPMGFKLAQVLRTSGLSPYQPILEGSIRAADEGSELVVSMRPHADARVFALAYFIVGLGLIVAGGLGWSAGNDMGVVAAIFGSLFLVFPRFRALHGFEQGCAAAQAALTPILEPE
ncbi:MAG: hypothetical protein GY913_29135 [Proteobacteria bacterium]|nr:hypothetical protein [Pseudomonadota bacterium]MCP4920979.1 hypothetical protein [Pseudomonadota bacterium]